LGTTCGHPPSIAAGDGLLPAFNRRYRKTLDETAVT
jgi:hypothetical protein